MFDRYVLGPRSMDVTVRHEERRAPTDESVKLLREMEAAARTSVVEAMRLPNSKVEAIVHRHEVYMDQRTVFVTHYAVNGKRREVVVSIEQAIETTIEKNIDTLHRALADDIAEFIIGSSIREIAGRKWL